MVFIKHDHLSTIHENKFIKSICKEQLKCNNTGTGELNFSSPSHFLSIPIVMELSMPAMITHLKQHAEIEFLTTKSDWVKFFLICVITVGWNNNSNIIRLI